MNPWLKGIVYFGILAWTLILNVYHAGVFPKPHIDLKESGEAHWMDRRIAGINQMILKGPAFARGRRAGELTESLLREQEEQLVAQLHRIFPTDFMVQGMILAAISYFQGVQRFLPLENVEEMYGTSFSASHQFDGLADGFTRQIAYHGLHEVGQMMVDQGFEDMGCTVAALRFKDSFVIGRNFDFEGGRIFDTEKIVKWVFPDHGYAFVSVIWAGMVGAVTGVNENGVYISINAAGSSDYRRIGTPSTLVLLDILQNAATTEQAIQILERAQMFITDIFVILDRGGQLVRVEKSPSKMEVLRLNDSAIVTNHLISPTFANDPTNIFRQAQLTTVAREVRGKTLLARVPSPQIAQEAVQAVLGILRDKGVAEDGEPLNLGNRRAIDALIATHSVIFDPSRALLYVSKGPALVGGFIGYDLKASFARQTPVMVDELPADPALTADDFDTLKEANQKIAKAQRSIRFHQCHEGLKLLREIADSASNQSPYYQAVGDAQSCLGERDKAREAWTKALKLHPAYTRFQSELERNLREK